MLGFSFGALSFPRSDLASSFQPCPSIFISSALTPIILAFASFQGRVIFAQSMSTDALNCRFRCASDQPHRCMVLFGQPS
jgi:hypothetical protein